jgi:outer membrane protein
MRNFAVTKLLTVLTVAVGVTSGLLMAQSASPTKIGTINLQQAVQGTQEAKAGVARLQREFVEPRTKALEAKQAEIRELQEKLQRAGNTLSQTAKDDQQLVINRKTKEFNREVEDYRADADDKQRELLADFSAKMQAVIDAYARDNGYAVIIDVANRDQSGLVWASPAVDVTLAIIEAYDKAHPVTGGAAPAAAKPAAAPPKATPAK